MTSATNHHDACYQRLRTLFPARELVWIEAEEHLKDDIFCRITLLCRNEFGQWERRRYRYDTLSEALFFMGATPVSEEEAARIRRTAPRLPTISPSPARAA
ncbi:MAG: hypothetical protein WHS83_10750 [Chloroflexus sp.]|uniref:hypothetical protein n=1 Tax=Chloroflexus sp. TaxID=1904827 RepID=UPI0017D1F1B8|nr:MAG: hypothetical protein KatS3mg056_3799 [Chloroflexus sp.]